MPLQLQCTAVVIRNDSMDSVFDDGAAYFETIAPNSMCYADEKLSQASFMSPIDAEEFCKNLEIRGLQRGRENPDFVVVTQHDQSVEPPCDWLFLFEWENRLIGTLRGWDSRKVIAPQHGGDEPIKHYSQEEIAEKFEFVKRENNVDTYRNKETGQLVYSARQTESDEEIFKSAFETIWQNKRNPGELPKQGTVVSQIEQAIEALQKVSANNPENPRVFLGLGLAWNAIGNLKNAARDFKKAVEIEPEETSYLKELAGVLLEQSKFADALKYSEMAVVVQPDNHELLGNLALVELLNGDQQRAKTTIEKALQFNPNDQINQHLRQVFDECLSGKRPQPKSLDELMTKPRKKSIWARLLGK